MSLLEIMFAVANAGGPGNVMCATTADGRTVIRSWELRVFKLRDDVHYAGLLRRVKNGTTYVYRVTAINPR